MLKRPSGAAKLGDLWRQWSGPALAGTSVANVVIMLSVLASGVLIARLLGPADRGLFAALLLWPGLLAAFGSMGLHQAVVMLMAKRNAEIAPPELVVMAHSIGIAVAATMALLFYSVAEIFPHVTAAPVAVFFLVVAASIASDAMNSVHHAQARYTIYNIVRIQHPMLYALAAFVLYLLQLQSVDLLMAAYTTSLLIPAVSCTVLLGRRLPRPTRAQYALLLKSGMLFHVPALFAIGLTYADRVLVVTLFEPDIVGHFFVAYAWAGAVVVAAVQPVRVIVFQQVAKSFGTQPQLTTVTGAAFVVALVVTLAATASIFLAPVLIPPLFGMEFALAAQLAVPLQVAMALGYLRSALIELSILTRLRGQQYLSDGVTAAVFLTMLGMAWPLEDVLDLIYLQIVAQTCGVLALVGWVGWRLTRAPEPSAIGREEGANAG